MRRIQVRALAAALLLALALTSCGQEAEPAASSAPAGPVIAIPGPEPEPAVPTGTNPLTGLPMEPEYESLRPVAVMLNNLKAAQPQLGQSLADIIYEVPAEGGITRMLAVYQSLDGVGDLGSIRSSRPYYVELALGHDALYVHAGGSPEAYEDIAAWRVDNMDGVNGGSDAEIFWRDPARRKTAGMEHSMLTSGENILSYLAQGRFETEHQSDYADHQTFAPEAAPAGEDAKTVTILYSQYKTGVFHYDAEQDAYLVEQYGQEYVDGNTGQQVAVKNLLILETAISQIPGDTYGRLNVRTTGEGEGAFFCGGKTIPIRWSRADRDSPFQYTTADGAPLVLEQGNRYVCILTPKTSTVTVS